MQIQWPAALSTLPQKLSLDHIQGERREVLSKRAIITGIALFALGCLMIPAVAALDILLAITVVANPLIFLGLTIQITGLAIMALGYYLHRTATTHSSNQ